VNIFDSSSEGIIMTGQAVTVTRMPGFFLMEE